MIKTILTFGIFFIGVAQANEPRVYSAQDLQKLGDGVFRELNLDGSGVVEDINILIAPETIKREETLKEIEKAMNIKNKTEVADIYKLVQQATLVPQAEETDSRNSPDTLPSVSNSMAQASSPTIPNQIPEKAKSQTQQMPSPILNSAPRSSGRLDNWINQNNKP